MLQLKTQTRASRCDERRHNVPPPLAGRDREGAMQIVTFVSAPSPPLPASGEGAAEFDAAALPSKYAANQWRKQKRLWPLAITQTP